MYNITLADGTELKNLELNGNNFISETVLSDSVFKDNLSKVVITNGETAETHEDMILLGNQNVNGQSWFILGEKTEQQKILERITGSLASNESTITDVQIALAEVFEMITAGGAM